MNAIEYNSIPEYYANEIPKEIWDTLTMDIQNQFFQIIHDPNSFFFSYKPFNQIIFGDDIKLSSSEEKKIWTYVDYFITNFGISNLVNLNKLWGYFAIPFEHRTGKFFKQYFSLPENTQKLFSIFSKHINNNTDQHTTNKIELIEKEARTFIIPYIHDYICSLVQTSAKNSTLKNNDADRNLNKHNNLLQSDLLEENFTNNSKTLDNYQKLTDIEILKQEQHSIADVNDKIFNTDSTSSDNQKIQPQIRKRGRPKKYFLQDTPPEFAYNENDEKNSNLKNKNNENGILSNEDEGYYSDDYQAALISDYYDISDDYDLTDENDDDYVDNTNTKTLRLKKGRNAIDKSKKNSKSKSIRAKPPVKENDYKYVDPHFYGNTNQNTNSQNSYNQYSNNFNPINNPNQIFNNRIFSNTYTLNNQTPPQALYPQKIPSFIQSSQFPPQGNTQLNINIQDQPQPHVNYQPAYPSNNWPGYTVSKNYISIPTIKIVQEIPQIPPIVPLGPLNIPNTIDPIVSQVKPNQRFQTSQIQFNYPNQVSSNDTFSTSFLHKENIAKFGNIPQNSLAQYPAHTLNPSFQTNNLPPQQVIFPSMKPNVIKKDNIINNNSNNYKINVDEPINKNSNPIYYQPNSNSPNQYKISYPNYDNNNNNNSIYSSSLSQQANSIKLIQTIETKQEIIDNNQFKNQFHNNSYSTDYSDSADAEKANRKHIISDSSNGQLTTKQLNSETASITESGSDYEYNDIENNDKKGNNSLPQRDKYRLHVKKRLSEENESSDNENELDMTKSVGIISNISFIYEENNNNDFIRIAKMKPSCLVDLEF